MWSKIIATGLVAAGVASAMNLKVAATGGNVSSPLMYGLMFEDINNSGDGGIYAELIQNRAFQGSTEFPSSLLAWSAVGGAQLTLQNTSVPLSSALPTSVNVKSSSTSGMVGIMNSGYWGMDVQPQVYKGSFAVMGSFKGKFTAKLQSALTGEVYATTDIHANGVAGNWTQHSFRLIPTKAAPNSNNTFVLEYDSSMGSVNFNLISLFPPTYKGTANGNRQDLMAALKGLNPSFLRMPGGNNIEGDAYHYPWRWNQTLGPLADRPGRPGTWGYQNTDGLGLIEYFRWCRDLDMEPLLAVWSGLFLDSSNTDFLSPEALAPYVQDTLNELEFLLGPVNSTYGAMRAALGYSRPFKFTYLEIGNEDNLNGGLPSYDAYRFNMFYDAITPLYPELILVSSSQDLSIVRPGSATDYHIYTRPDDFVQRFNYFDNIPRGTKFFNGEYANIQYNLEGQPSAGTNWSAPRIDFPIWVGAVSESVWSIGFERNTDLGIGMSYAPGFQNLNRNEWTPDLISFDADTSHTVLSTSYRAIELLSAFRYKKTVPVTSDTGFGPAYYVAGVSDPGAYTMKIAIYNSTAALPFNVMFEGVKPGQMANLTVLTAPDGLSSNKLVNGKPVDVVMRNVTSLVAGSSGELVFELENYAIAVLTT